MSEFVLLDGRRNGSIKNVNRLKKSTATFLRFLVARVNLWGSMKIMRLDCIRMTGLTKLSSKRPKIDSN